MEDHDRKLGDGKKSISLESDILSHDDAILCLTDQIDVVVPVPDVGVCNNLDEYFIKSTISTQRAQRISSNNPLKSLKSHNHLGTTSRTSPEQIFVTPQVRNFEKILKKTDDEQVTRNYQSSSSTRKKLDVFSKIEQLDPASGPLSLLKKKINSVVKVLIRRRQKVPFISRVIEYKGTLILFDKHMNLYLRDVIESFKYSQDEKLLKRARHRDDILVRGDNIILIS